jgi:branched-chain amino acid transport system substrate-binding protein
LTLSAQRFIIRKNKTPVQDLPDGRSAMKFATLLAGTFLGLATFSAAAQDTAGVSKDSIKLGILGSLTGPAAIWGTGNRAGAILAFEEANASGGVNGRKIEWVVEDDETSPPKAIAAFKKLTEQDGVFAVFGPAASAISAAMVPVMQQSGVPVFISVPSTPSVTEPTMKNVFRSGPLNDRLQGIAVADYAIGKLHGQKIAVIRQSDEYGKRGADSIVDRMKQEKLDPVASEEFAAGDTDFTSQLLKIRGADPDVLIVYGYPSPSAIITRQARQLGISAKILGSNATSSRKYPQIVGQAAAGIENVITVAVLPESDDPKAVAFSKKFAERYPDLAKQERPDLGDVLGYGGALTFLEGLKRAGPDLTRSKFIAALETIQDFHTGLTMPTTFSATSHEGNKAARVVQIQPDLTRKLLPDIIAAPDTRSQ